MKSVKKRDKKRIVRKSRQNRKKRKGGSISRRDRVQPIPLPKVPQPINPVRNVNIHRNIKGGFKADIVDNIEDRDDDWLITKQ